MLALQESKEHRDITFLSEGIDLPSEKDRTLCSSATPPGPVEDRWRFLLCPLRKNTLLKNDIATPYRFRLSIDINTEALPLLYDAALADEKDHSAGY